ncbi:PAS domain-containing protein [Mucilaginibacter daejeonensis]|uniref:PAS domain-containing sensor histidine kinase n=1 Tax=Mucilaginibacter daejeonensis TaxID=398049 RepID=UPI001D1748D5|nr:PAS domain-containing sensor histidine kinase [Mucilaginibacter daejeonensis]UEG51931.1 PAS domain-containing protein [Mucilaginibacter daejeonensis]
MSEKPKSISDSQDLDLRLFATAMDATVNGIVITDNRQPDNPIIYCNKAFETLTGYRHDEIIGHNCRFLQGKDRDQIQRKVIRRTIEEGEHCNLEIRNYKKDGTPFWNQLVISPVKDQEGNVTHFIGVQNDVTRRRDAEQQLQTEKELLETRVVSRTKELQDSEDYLGSIVETIRESLLVLDDQIKVLSVNEHFCKFFKLEAKDVVGKLLYEISDSAWDVPELRAVLEDILPHNNPFEGFEIEHHFPKIGKRLLVLNARQIKLKGKYKDRILLAMEDLTDRREVEQRKEDFITVASHEMKTPLTTIKGHIQILTKRAEKNNSDADLRSLAVTNRSIDRLDALINDLLDVSKIQSGRMKFNLTEFNFMEVVHNSVEAVRETTDTHEIVVTGDASRTVKADFFRLEQVMINLLTNAIKYSPSAKEIGVHLNILAGFIKVAVTDSGVGIKREDHKKIFERFYRSDNVQFSFQGLGIGLYVSNQIIAEHNGTLWVESEEGQGSVFNFTIPYVTL